jgi:glycosyltransferase involved in cell wall biosynthesis
MTSDFTGILIIGPIFNTASGPTGQPGQLFNQLANANYKVIRASHHHNKILRMIHTIWVVLTKRKKYDLILLQSFGLLAFVMEDIVSRIAVYLNKPIVFTLRGGAFFEFYSKYPKWVKKVLSRSHYITSPSKYLIQHFEKVGIKVNYLPNAIDLKSFTFNQSERRPRSLLWVRAFHEIYDPELAINVVMNLKSEYPDILLTMIGKDQGSLAHCNKLIQEYHLENNINILGYVPNAELPGFYHSHEIFITTTRYESFGNSLMEAASAGIPSVCVPVGEIPYLWEHDSNILFAERNVSDYSEKVRMCINDADLRSKLALQARANAEKFTWGSVLNQWERLIREISPKSSVTHPNNI